MAQTIRVVLDEECGQQNFVDEKDCEVDKDGESIVLHINIFMGLVNQLAAAKFPLDDVMHALLLVYTLPNNLKNLVVSLNTSCQYENLSVQVVKPSILNKETRKGANMAQHLAEEEASREVH